MRTRIPVLTAALVLGLCALAWAQGQQAPPQSPVPTPPQGQAAPTLGTVDFGFRGTSVDGDEARYERYRDLRTGANVNVGLARQTDDYTLALSARNIGYRDGFYGLDYTRDRLAVSFSFDQTPLNFGYYTLTPWTTTISGDTARLSLDPAPRTAIETRQPGVVGIPTTAALLNTPSIWRNFALPFDLQSRRDTLGLALAYNATRNLAARFTLRSSNRSGAQPWGASFAFNNGNEVPVPLENRTTDFTAGVEWANQRGMVRVAWDASWFNNDIQVLEWDNPIRATDFNNGRLPPLGPYDPSGYSNGNGPAFGRMALWPSNTMNTVSTVAMVKLPGRSTVNGVFAVTSMKQDEELIPWTSNALINTPTVLAAFPHLAQLDRPTAEAEVRGVNGTLNFTSRFHRQFALHARYRFNDHDNRTPPYDAREYVRFDAVPEETGDFTPELDIQRQSFDANLTFNGLRYTALRVGYGRDKYERTGRDFVGTTDNTFRVSADTIGNQWVSVRAIYEYTDREGRGFSKDALEEGGYQEGLRFYDESDRTRNRATVLLTLTPTTFADVTASYGTGRDKYEGEGHEFGLLDNDNTFYSLGLNFTPRDNVAFGVSYAREQYEAMQESRNANPPGTDYGSWLDPNRNWRLDNDEKVNNVGVYLDLNQVIAKTNIRLGYDFSDSDNAFIYSGPRIRALSENLILTPGDTRPCGATATSCFEPLPNVTNTWHRVTADVRYFLTTRVGIGASYWFEDFQVNDFATIGLSGPAAEDDPPRVDYLGALITGYGNRPYRANTGFLRVFYLF